MQGVRGERATPGEFRQTQNWIGSRRCTIAEAKFVPPPPAEMMVALEEWEQYIHGDDIYPPLVRLAFAHYQFETIHPFLDGNGRIGRLLLALLLVTWKLLPLPLLYLSAYFEQYREDYYDLLQGVSEHGRWRDWIIFFLRGVAEQSRETIVRAKRLYDLQLEWHRRLLATPRTSVLLMHLVDELFQTPALTIPRVQELVGVTHRAASQMVDRLVEEYILYPIPGRQRNRQFVARKILEILGTEVEE
jgi:Fic family protein